ncbi:hypothetical protein RhiJN_05273 [Ceratobasidium sp. AG-Ba]|nr:hypothetical protein RhiJN_05273 [Ceratobasidium sp. AG-Ba]QRW06187.1 hypothetical protein RhiLY_05186 [Ceratobasidium sp. AG-Ba]
MLHDAIASAFRSSRTRASPSRDYPLPVRRLEDAIMVPYDKGAGVESVMPTAISPPNLGLPPTSRPSTPQPYVQRPRDAKWLNIFDENADPYRSDEYEEASYREAGASGSSDYSSRVPAPPPATEILDFRNLDRPAPMGDGNVSSTSTMYCESPRPLTGHTTSYGSYVGDGRHYSTLGGILGEMEGFNQNYFPREIPPSSTNSSGTPVDDQSFSDQQAVRSNTQDYYPYAS